MAQSGIASVVGFLDSHSGAVAAASTVALLVVATVFAALMWRFASVARRQTSYLQDQEAREASAARRTLWARSTYLLRQVAKLPEVLETAALPKPAWREQDERALEEAATVFGAATIIHATEAVRGLELIRKQCLNLQAARSHQLSPFPFEQLNSTTWHRTYSEVRDALTHLETLGAGLPVSDSPWKDQPRSGQ